MRYKGILLLLTALFLLLTSFSFYSYGRPPPTRPDLTIESIEFTPPNPIISQSVTIEIVVKNIGTDMSYSVNGSLLIDYDEIEVIVIPQLNHNIDTTLTVYWIPDALGIHIVSFIADCYQKVNEDDESNNVMEVNVTVGGGNVDLEVIDVVYLPEMPTIGNNVSFKPTIRNIGTTYSPYCEGSLYINGEIYTTVFVPSVSAGYTTLLEPIKWVPDSLGSYLITFWIDSDMIIDEPDEENNNYSITINVAGEDTNPPEVTITYLPETVTEMDTVNFYATATDENGISYIEIAGHTEPSHQYFSHICNDVNFCNHTFGPFPRKDKVYYYAQARDRAGLDYQTPEHNFTVESYYKQALTVDISVYPENPTSIDEITFTATASYPYGVSVLRLINYKYNYTVKEEEEVTNISVTLGPFATGATLMYYAQAEDVDGNIVNTSIKRITIGEISLTNTRNVNAYEQGIVFLISDQDWRTVLSLVPISIWRETDNSIISSSRLNGHVSTTGLEEGAIRYDSVRFPVLVYHYENDTAVDIKPIVNFLNYRWRNLESYQNGRSKVVIIGTPPSIVLETLAADRPIGAGLSEDDIELWEADTTPVTQTYTLNVRLPMTIDIAGLRGAMTNRWQLDLSEGATTNTFSSTFTISGVPSDDYQRMLRQHYWSDINKVVISDNDYYTALWAAVYASHMNAPLLFKDHYNLEDIDHKHVMLIGEFTETEKQEFRDENADIMGHYIVDEMPSLYLSAVPATHGVNDFILINPLDPWVGVRKSSSSVFSFQKFYYQQSLLSPFLAAAKRSVLVAAPSLSYVEIDQMLQDEIDSLYPAGATPYITVLASPTAIPMARPNWPSHVALRDSKVYFEVFNYNDIDIKMVNLRTGDSKIYSLAGHQFSPVVVNGMVGARNFDGNIGGYTSVDDFNLVVKDKWTQHQEAGENLIVYHRSTSEENGNDIFLCSPGDLNAYYYVGGDIDVVAETTDNECNPDISYDEKFVVWQQNHQGDWNIHYQFINKEHGEDLYFGAYVTIARDRMQINPSLHHRKIVYQDDRNGNWDIYLHDLDNPSTGASEDLRLNSNSGNQIYPKIWDDKVVYQDDRNGNWDIYLYDLSTGRERRLTTNPSQEVRPVINSDWIVWYEETNDGFWHIWAYDLDTGTKVEVDTTLVAHEDSLLLFKQVDAKFYADIDNDGYMDYPTGRVFGLTTSDLSAYVATDIFFDEVEKNRDALCVVRGWSSSDTREYLTDFSSNFWTDDVQNEFDNHHFYVTYAELSANLATILRYFWGSHLTIFVDHGNPVVLDGLVSSGDFTDNYFKYPAFILDRACSTAGYYLTEDKNLLITTLIMRAGGMCFLGAVDLSNGHEMFDELLNMSFLDDNAIGKAFKEGKNSSQGYHDVYLFFGDPTIKPRWWS